jgi:hypothetical protein
MAAVPRSEPYLLKHVLRDWTDDDAIRLLSRCRDAGSPGARVVIVDRLVGTATSPTSRSWRTSSSWRCCAAVGTAPRRSSVDADLRRITPLPTGRTVLEAAFRVR